jgi:rfaE bifunctional protein nucleotidyltransferase chain/domain
MRPDSASKVVPLPELLAWRGGLRRADRTVAWTNGCFDLMHAGHARSLEAASRLADALVVGVNSDESVRCLKGSSRPLVPQAERAALVAALGCVDRVVIFDQLTPEVVLAELRPDAHCKGEDYATPHGKPIPEQALVESYGGRVAFIPLEPGLSTTALTERLRSLPARTGPPRPALFLDRDGTLIEDAGYPRDPSLVRPLPGTAEALRTLASAGFLLVVVSNQSGVGRGLITPEEAAAVHSRFEACFAAEGVRFDACLYCFHTPAAGCPCRKPSPGLLLRAAADLNIALPASCIVGDKDSDTEAGLRAGCRAAPLGPGGWPAVLAAVLGGAGPWV